MKSKINKIKYTLSVLSIFLVIMFINGCKSNSNYSTNSNPPSSSSNSNQILMQGNAFSPSTTTVAVGTTVTWTNKDSYNHTVTSGSPGSPDGMFDSGNIGANSTFSFKFDKSGTYNYYCKIHSPMMTGIVKVQ